MIKSIVPLVVVKYSLIILVVGLTQACSLSVPIDDPDISKRPYVSNGSSSVEKLYVKDSFSEKDPVSYGRVKINLIHDGSELNPSSYIISGLKKELESRQLPVEYSDSGGNTLDLQKFEVFNHRVSGFSPMVTISTIKADLITEKGKKKVSAMVKRGKVPVWSMAEINEPCYNEPMELLVKEVAAKINKSIFGYSLDDSEVDKLVSKIKSESETNKLAYFDVYELGFSNNPKAIEPLKEFTKHKGDYIRMAAISGLGILGVESYLDELKSIYKDAKLWQDRGMALKAIGDIGSDEAMEFLRQEKSKWKDQTSNEAKWNVLVIDLYL